MRVRVGINYGDANMEELPEEFEQIKAKKDASTKTLETAMECIRREKCKRPTYILILMVKR